MDRWYEEGNDLDTEWERVAQYFVKHFVSGELHDASNLLTEECQQRVDLTTLQKMRKFFIDESYDAPLGPVWLQNSWNVVHGKRQGDMGQSYVNIGGTHAQAVTVLVTTEAGNYRIREVEWGRP